MLVIFAGFCFKVGKLMAMYDQDPDVVAWGLDLLSGCPPYHNSEYSETIIHRDDIGYNENYTMESIDNTDNCTIENDEVIAHALQEEFSELASVEASDHLHASVLAQVWDKFDNDGIVLYYYLRLNSLSIFCLSILSGEF